MTFRSAPSPGVWDSISERRVALRLAGREDLVVTVGPLENLEVSVGAGGSKPAARAPVLARACGGVYRDGLPGGHGGVEAGCGRGGAGAEVRDLPPRSEYPAMAAWAKPGAGRHFLLLPLNEVVDERYTVYWDIASAGG